MRLEVEAFDYYDNAVAKIPGGRNCKAYVQRLVNGFPVRVWLRGALTLLAERVS